MTESPPFLDQYLAPFRLWMLFMAPPELPDYLLGDWPVLLGRGQDGTWGPLDFGRSQQARRLACLLVLHREGLSAKRAGLALSPRGVDGKGERQNAKHYLREALRKFGVDDLLVLPDKGGRGAPRWALRQVTTDIAIAADAAREERWPLAAALTHRGGAILVGIPPPVRPVEGWKSATPLSGVRNGREKSRGSLPAEFIDLARDTASRVRSHRTQWKDRAPIPDPFNEFGPKPKQPGETKPVIDGVVEPAGVLVPPSRVRRGAAEQRAPSRTLGELATGVTRLQLRGVAHDGLGYEVVVFPLGEPPRQRSPAPRRALVAAPVAVLLLAIIVVAGPLPFGTDRDGERAMLAGFRREQETFNHDVKTFRSPARLSEEGPAISAGQVVQVSCRMFAPSIESVSPDGYWYRISSAPWNNQYYAPANTFLNGDSATEFLGGRQPKPGDVHNTDFAVAICGGPPGSLETSRAANITTFADPRTGTRPGPVIRARRSVVASCRVYTPRIPSTVPQGYSYRIASPPWRNRYYAPARAFLNGDSPPSPATRLTDLAVPNC